MSCGYVCICVAECVSNLFVQAAIFLKYVYPFLTFLGNIDREKIHFPLQLYTAETINKRLNVGNSFKKPNKVVEYLKVSAVEFCFKLTKVMFTFSVILPCILEV